jgi:hypothetical protein
MPLQYFFYVRIYVCICVCVCVFAAELKFLIPMVEMAPPPICMAVYEMYHLPALIYGVEICMWLV